MADEERRLGRVSRASNWDCWRSNSSKWYQELWFAGFSGYLGSIKKGSLWSFFLEGVEGFSSWATSIIRTLCGYLSLWMRSLTLEDVMATLNSKKIKEMSKAKGDDGKGLYVRGRNDHRDSRQSRGKSRSKSRGGRLKCYICQSEDHLKRNCSKNNRKKSTSYVKKDDQPSSSGLIYDDSEVMMLMSVEALLDLIMDSGCSYHMTPRLDIFFDFLECDGGSVLLGDNKECKIRGIGKVRVQLRDGSSFVLNNVGYILELKRNLISLRTLEKEEYTVKMQSGKVKVINGSSVVLSGTRRENYVYSLDGNAVAGLQVLEKQGLFGKESLGKLGFYDNCVIGKSHRFRFGVGRNTTQGVIDYVHSDLWGLYHVESLGENQTGRTIKKLRTDIGLEFCNREFEELCNESEIARQLTVVGTPQQNGLVERVNRTLIDKVLCLLIQSGLPKTFWAKATCKLEPRAVKCVLLGYPEGVKGYRLYRLDGNDKSVEELHVEVELQRLNNHTLKEDKTYQEYGDDEDVGDQETDQTPNLTDYQLTRDREPKTRTKPLRFQDESNMTAYAFAAAEEEDTHEPLTYQEAVAYEDNHPAGQKLMNCKWLFKIKEGIEGVQKPRYKARLVARGFTQKVDIYYNEVFSPVIRYASIQVILALTACKDYELEQLDVKTAFLHGNLEEVIYMRQPPGYEQGNKVCLLKKSLYGLKQSPRQWYRRFDEYTLSNGFKRSNYDSCVYYNIYAPGEYVYLLLYVDDMLIACKNNVEIGSTKSLLKREFDMKDLEEAKKILGVEIVKDRSRKILRVSQSGYISKILNNLRIDNGKLVQMLLSGHFKLSLKDCPVRDCDVKRMSMVPYLANSGKNHWEAVKWILNYLRGTANVGLVYGTDRSKHMDVTGFVDSDYAKDPKKGRSITGYAFLVQGCVVSWKATLQHVVTLSTTEAEYIAFTEAVKEAIWLKGLLEELGVELNTVAVNCDNRSAIHLSGNLVFHERTKHINARYQFIREVLKAKTVKVLKVGTEHNVTDALTNVVHGQKLQHCLELLSVGVG
nr:retrotransposon protein, putative, Ty1-copia subclass [Tanacetum cinerariifolium]